MQKRKGNMSPKKSASTGSKVIDIDVAEEMRGSFLEYAYSVIYSRALPDARDGLKPVQRRILFQMAQMGLRPDRGHVKSARVVGEVMGRLHPHGDSAIYDALVRMAQDFSLRLPLIDGHGNFGSLDDGPAAMRYTEARLAATALAMTDGIDEDVVDFTPNYDGREVEPVVLPAALPNLLVNGASGIAVGMATNLAPHNLTEVVNATRLLIAHPESTLEQIMAFMPGPDFATGGVITGLEGIREAYETGRGSFRIRARTRIEQVSPRKRGIVVTELPTTIGPERIIERVKELVVAKKIQGISDIVDLTDGDSGLNLVIECKSTFSPEAILEQLFKMTPLEESFTINAVTLVNGQPQTLGVRELLQVFIDHRIEVVTRRTEYRKIVAQDRLHLLDGLLIAILDIDEVIQLIRNSDDSADARVRLIDVFDLSEVQANYILEMPLRRLTKFSRIELEKESDLLRNKIEDLESLLADPSLLRERVSLELGEVAAQHASPRRTLLLESSGVQVPKTSVALEVPDEPCFVLLSSTGLLARTSAYSLPSGPQNSVTQRQPHDCIISVIPATTRGEIGVMTSTGDVHRISVVDIPSIPSTVGVPGISGGAPLGAFIDLPRDTQVVAIIPIDSELLIFTRLGTVKRLAAGHSISRPQWDAIRLEPNDSVVAAVSSTPERFDICDAVMVSSQGQLLHFPVKNLRAQGRSAGGVSGMKLNGSHLVFGGVVDPSEKNVIATVSGSSQALPGTELGNAKVTYLSEYPAKGRATAGVRCHKFRSGEDLVLNAWAGVGPARGATSSGMPAFLPDPDDRRDGTGSPLALPIDSISGNISP